MTEIETVTVTFEELAERGRRTRLPSFAFVWSR